MKNTTKFKAAKTIKEYSVKAFGYDLVIPVGSPVSNNTACGNDDSYRFLGGVGAFARAVTGVENSILLWDLTHYGLNIPAEFCEPY